MADEVKSWPVVSMKLSELKPADYNPRKISERSLSGLTASISRFGMVEPIVWNKRTGNIVGGHQRHKVLSEEGVEETEVVVVDIDEGEEVALNITLNNPHIQGEYSSDVKDLLLGIKGEEMFTELRLDDLLGETARKSNEMTGALGRKFLLPPFSILEASHDLWVQRAEEWKTLGVGEGDGYWGDPVLCEVMCLWFSAPNAVVVGPSGQRVWQDVVSQLGRSAGNPVDGADLLLWEYREEENEKAVKAMEGLREHRFAIFIPRSTVDEMRLIEELMGRGFTYYNEIGLVRANLAVPAFVESRTLAQIHRKILVFVKGDAKRASDTCGDVVIPKVVGEG